MTTNRISTARGGPDTSVMRLALRYVGQRRRRGEIADATARTYRDVLTAFAREVGDDFDVKRLTRRQIDRFMERPAGQATRRTRFSVLRNFCQWLVIEGHLKKDPTVRLKLPKVPRTVPRGLTHDQVVALFAKCPDLRAQLLVSLMVQEGLRRKEVAGLEVGDVDLRERLLLVRHGKGEHQRVLPLSEETERLLVRYLHEFGAPNGPLIRSYRHPHRGMTPDRVGQIVSSVMLDAGVRQWGKRAQRPGQPSPHALRHTAATDMLRNGAHVRDVQAALGHSNLATTQRYLPWTVGDLRTAMGGRSYRSNTEPYPAVNGDSDPSGSR